MLVTYSLSKSLSSKRSLSLLILSIEVNPKLTAVAREGFPEKKEYSPKVSPCFNKLKLFESLSFSDLNNNFTSPV
jgi:hypothetical protein